MHVDKMKTEHLTLDVNDEHPNTSSEKRTSPQEGQSIMAGDENRGKPISREAVQHPYDTFSKDEILPRLDQAKAASNQETSTRKASDGPSCRICLEEDELKNMETTCACSGSIKFAHRICVERWCDEKGNRICEICHQAYEGAYKIRPGPFRSHVVPVDFSADSSDPNFLALEGGRQYGEADENVRPNFRFRDWWRCGAGLVSIVGVICLGLTSKLWL